MDEYESLSHSKWECTYHVIFIPKVAGVRSTGNCGSIWERCSDVWPSRKRVESRRGI
jgi:hypothetical protein